MPIQITQPRLRLDVTTNTIFAPYPFKFRIKVAQRSVVGQSPSSYHLIFSVCKLECHSAVNQQGFTIVVLMRA